VEAAWASFEERGVAFERGWLKTLAGSTHPPGSDIGLFSDSHC
jgi:hypothetical protein